MQGYGSVSSMLGQVAQQRGRFIEARAAFLHAEQLKAKGGASSVYAVYKQQHRCPYVYLCTCVLVKQVGGRQQRLRRL
jgi:hypothetical protein